MQLAQARDLRQARIAILCNAEGRVIRRESIQRSPNHWQLLGLFGLQEHG
jgi:hypothetical protein